MQTARNTKGKQKIALVAAIMTPDKSQKVHTLAKLFKDYWASYDRQTLIDQTKEIEGLTIERPESLSTEELLTLLYNEDVRIWSHKSVPEIDYEIKQQKMMA